MKKIIKIIIAVAIILVLIVAVRYIFNFSILDSLKNVFGGTELKGTRVNIGQEISTPVFEIVSLEIFYPKNLAVIEADKFEWWRLNIGTVFIFLEYDSYIRLGVRSPETIKIERKDDIVYVDESTIVIELLDAKLNNYKHIRTFTSNPFVQNRASEEYIFQAINNMEVELTNKIIENGQTNFDLAKKNFMENYKNLCKAAGLEVVWR